MNTQRTGFLTLLTHEESIWDWFEVHEEALGRLQDKIMQVPILKYESPEEKLTFQCDASESGLAAALTQ